ncbi:hypothetical protein JCGZ_16369 [Jatropha curcas]|uniref:Uncharacterized protein n=1 Tax=Jatropha curcas TaxID=180498 RepID=A0A067L7U5_JATCU|nr:hypothetical protein JCGZ_16369 [Jatropha curcas]
MRREAKKQSKLVKILLAPINVLRKTTDFYATCVDDCGAKVGAEGAVFCPVPSMRFTASSSISHNDREIREPLRSMSEQKRAREAVQKLNSNMYVPRKQVMVTSSCGGYSGINKRYGSVVVGKLGAIEEEHPLFYEED